MQTFSLLLRGGNKTPPSDFDEGVLRDRVHGLCIMQLQDPGLGQDKELVVSVASFCFLSRSRPLGLG